jgi:hypothetical protein
MVVIQVHIEKREERY